MMNGMDENSLCFKIIKGIPSTSELNILESLYAETFEDARLDFFSKRLTEKDDVCSLIAFENNTPIGFKIGYNYNEKTFYSWVGGILPKYRRNGVAKKLAQLQEQWAKKNNYLNIRTKSMNQFKPMMILNLKNGFDIVSIYTNSTNQTKIVFEKQL
ncbi:Acetyltransferase (GNAT) family protein [Lutibacter oricola]|uniref:Acetyltransferase (GNAT) family protein n=1 Tax=Lutibacter oricola TaxID=762486 RepID=A0A1H2RXQ8_9FLAO|nr:GNAT family N-acetyltransferase [Lutibacter oricola]SDW23564.1 Acetyltransferase (GNAT) family protein [Lutibacter oricola]